MRQLLIVAPLLLASATSAHAADAALPDWLAGHWCNSSDGESGEELWLPAAGGLMLGVNRTVASGRATQFEFLRIESGNGVPTYIAQPGGAAPTAFARSDSGENWMRFSNPAHDFPQHIEYRREGNQLKASIAGPDEDGKEMRIDFAYSNCSG